MVCKILYVSEYIKNCDISKFGEGCEQCLPLFKSSWIVIIGVVILCIIILSIILTLTRRGSFINQNGDRVNL